MFRCVSYMYESFVSGLNLLDWVLVNEILTHLKACRQPCTGHFLAINDCPSSSEAILSVRMQSRTSDGQSWQYTIREVNALDDTRLDYSSGFKDFDRFCNVEKVLCTLLIYLKVSSFSDALLDWLTPTMKVVHRPLRYFYLPKPLGYLLLSDQLNILRVECLRVWLSSSFRQYLAGSETSHASTLKTHHGYSACPRQQYLHLTLIRPPP